MSDEAFQTFRITYLDKYENAHTVELPAEDVESAIESLEDQLDEQVTVSNIDILDDQES